MAGQDLIQTVEQRQDQAAAQPGERQRRRNLVLRAELAGEPILEVTPLALPGRKRQYDGNGFAAAVEQLARHEQELSRLAAARRADDQQAASVVLENLGGRTRLGHQRRWRWLERVAETGDERLLQRARRPGQCGQERRSQHALDPELPHLGAQPLELNALAGARAGAAGGRRWSAPEARCLDAGPGRG